MLRKSWLNNSQNQLVMKKYIKPVSIIYNVELNEMLCASMPISGFTGENGVTTAEVGEERQFEDGSDVWGQTW